MFKDKLEFKKLAEEIYLYENFLSEDEVKNLHRIAESLTEQDWMTENTESYHEDKNSVIIPELKPVLDRLVDLFEPDHQILPSQYFVRQRPGQDMFVHADSPGPEHPEEVTANDPYNTCHLVVYGVVIYINDNYEGGETYYPDLGIEHKGKPGDLIIHDSGSKYKHGVKTVVGNTRYCYINFVFPKM